MKYSVYIQPSGMEFSTLDDVSILESAINSDIYLEHSCMDGSCGACKAKLIQGNVRQGEKCTGLNEQEIKDGYILTCCSQAESDIKLKVNYYSELASIKRSIQPCKVESIIFPVDNVAVLRLKLPPSADFKYAAGQYIQLIVQGKRRSYSIANIAETYSGIEIHVKKVEQGVFSEYIFGELSEKQLLRLEGPYGTFFVRNTGLPIIFIAGGTGFAPVKAMVEQLIKDGTSREIWIYWGNSKKQGFYTNVAEEWQSYKNIRYIPVLSGNEGWNGRKGMVHEAVLDDIGDLSMYEVYACGAPDMIEKARYDFLSKGLLPGNFYSDAFLSSK